MPFPSRAGIVRSVAVSVAVLFLVTGAALAGRLSGSSGVRDEVAVGTPAATATPSPNPTLAPTATPSPTVAPTETPEPAPTTRAAETPEPGVLPGSIETAEPGKTPELEVEHESGGGSQAGEAPEATEPPGSKGEDASSSGGDHEGAQQAAPTPQGTNEMLFGGDTQSSSGGRDGQDGSDTGGSNGD